MEMERVCYFIHCAIYYVVDLSNLGCDVMEYKSYHLTFFSFIVMPCHIKCLAVSDVTGVHIYLRALSICLDKAMLNLDSSRYYSLHLAFIYT
jgi:hypothetical protein